MGNQSGDYAFLSAPNGGALKSLGLLSGYNTTFGFSVNASGQVAGSARNSGDDSHAFLSAPNGGVLKDLGTLGGIGSEALGVNDPGQVTGDSVTATGATHAFLSASNGGVLKDLGTLLGYSYDSGGRAVNASGQVAGVSDSYTNGGHAFLSAPNGGALKDLGTLGGRDSEADGVNDAGQVVGNAYTATEDPYSSFGDAFLYTATGGMVDLNSMLDASGANWKLNSADDISNTDYITGYGTINGQIHAFLLTPTPEPAPLAALGVGALALVRRRKA